MQNTLHTGKLRPKRLALVNSLHRHRSLIVEMIAALFILLFLYTAISKTFYIRSTVDVLKKTPIFSNYAIEVGWGIVVMEYLVAALLFLPKTRTLGLFSSLALMTGFTIYIGYMMAFVPNLPCTCGGVISKMTWAQHLIFNVFFVLLAFVAFWLSRKGFGEKEESKAFPIVFT